MAKSYFAILGVASGASPQEIRSAYRRLVKAYHPDRYEGGSEPFRHIQEAYSVLGNPARRRAYEQSRVAGRTRRRTAAPTGPAPEPLIPEPQPVDLGEISPIRSFETVSPSAGELFDWLWKNFSSLDRPKSGRVQNLTLEVPLTRDQARHGGHARVMVPAQALCPVCRGRGGVGPYECLRCAGEGAIAGEVPVAIAFPSGLTREHAVVVPLDHFGIRNLHLTVLFRLRDGEGPG